MARNEFEGSTTVRRLETMRTVRARRRGRTPTVWTTAVLLVLALAALPMASAGAATHVVPRSAAPNVRPLAGAPLSLANFAVTDLSTGQTSNYQNEDVAANTACLVNASFLCFKLGSGDSFTVTTPSAIQAGAAYATPQSAMTLTVGGVTCGEFSSVPGSVASMQLDQFHFTATNPQPVDTFAAQISCSNDAVSISGTIAFNVANTTPNEGYYLYDNQGNTYGFANDSYLTYLGGPGYLNLNKPIVSMDTTPDGAGYWMTAADGGVFAYGDAGFYGSTGNIALNRPVVGMAATNDGGGYWFVASDGGVFAYGDAPFYGSMGGKHLNQPIVGMTPTADGRGYWLVASDGGIFAFGDAAFYGSTGGMHLNKPIVGMTATANGHGYWLVASDGGVFAYGDAGFFGSAGSLSLNQPVTGIASTGDDGGYLLVAADGGLFNYGDAPFYGSLGAQGFSGVVGIVP